MSTAPETEMTGWFGGADDSWNLRTVPVPIASSTQLLVRTDAAALNNADADLARPGEEFLAGFEVCGRVVAVGAPDLQHLLGTQVAGTTRGTLAEYVAIDHRWVLQVPDGVDAITAAAVPTALLTEHGALREAGFMAGQDVLVTGATSSIGLVGVQIAKALGAARVVATTRTADKIELLTGVGADRVVVAADADDLTRELDGERYDVVLDHVGAATFAACVGLTSPGGQLVSVGRLAGAETTLDLTALASAGVCVRSVSYGFADPDQIGAVLSAASAELGPLVEQERICPVIDQVLGFDQAPQALAHLRSGQARGKIVLRVA